MARKSREKNKNEQIRGQLMKDVSTFFSNKALAHNLIFLFEDINEMIVREARNKGFGVNYSREQRDGFFFSFFLFAGSLSSCGNFYYFLEKSEATKIKINVSTRHSSSVLLSKFPSFFDSWICS